MNKLKIVLISIVALVLGGCASGAKMDAMILANSETTNATYDNALKNEVSVEKVKGGKETNPAWTSQISDKAFMGALKSSLKSHGLYGEKGRYHLTAELQKLDQPLFGLDMTVTSHVNYKLVDSATGEVVMEKLVVTPYTATVGDAFAGVTRLRMANEGAGKENIRGLLDALAKLNIEANQVSMN
ncbi:hypothetical protein [Ferrimonas sp.]|uniref:hypothetical protein n=1 Tax=Ferrimonas sp. TaxID=2080861 RepID=UPI003A934C45